MDEHITQNEALAADKSTEFSLLPIKKKKSGRVPDFFIAVPAESCDGKQFANNANARKGRARFCREYFCVCQDCYFALYVKQHY